LGAISVFTALADILPLLLAGAVGFEKAAAPRCHDHHGAA
jgi:hypothetical protein